MRGSAGACRAAASAAASAAVGALGGCGGARMTEVAHAAWEATLRPGAFAVDMTCGGGRDTLFLARAVGSEGRVLACDLQADALASTRSILESRTGDNLAAVRLREGCHSTLTLREAMEGVGWSAEGCGGDGTGASSPPLGRPSLVCFNLGYLPGGDRAVKTTPRSTVPAVELSLDLLGNGGLLSVLCYVGHEGGAEERGAVEAVLMGLSSKDWACSELRTVNRPGCPVLYLAERLSESDETQRMEP